MTDKVRYSIEPFKIVHVVLWYCLARNTSANKLRTAVTYANGLSCTQWGHVRTFVELVGRGRCSIQILKLFKQFVKVKSAFIY